MAGQLYRTSNRGKVFFAGVTGRGEFEAERQGLAVILFGGFSQYEDRQGK